MGWLFDNLTDWLRQLLTDAIMVSYYSMFDTVNTQVTDLAVQVGQTPESWHSGVFAMIGTLSESVVLPIAGVILTYIMCYELIQLVLEKNNMADFDTFNIFKWLFKTFVAVFILTHTFDIVMSIFSLAQRGINQSAGLITGSLDLGSGMMMATIYAQLQSMGIAELYLTFYETQIVTLGMNIMAIIIFIMSFGRMIEIYLVTSLAPIPLSTMANKEWGQMGNNYLRSLAALAFQGFLIMVCLAIYALLISTIPFTGHIHFTSWTVLGYCVLLCFALLKSGNLAKSIFNAH